MHDIKVLLKIEFKRLFKSRLLYISLIMLFPVLMYLKGLQVEWHFHFLYSTDGWEVPWEKSHFLQHMYMYACYLQRYLIVDYLLRIIKTNIYYSIIAEYPERVFMFQDLLQHSFQVEWLFLFRFCWILWWQLCFYQR